MGESLDLLSLFFFLFNYLFLSTDLFPAASEAEEHEDTSDTHDDGETNKHNVVVATLLGAESTSEIFSKFEVRPAIRLLILGAR